MLELDITLPIPVFTHVQDVNCKTRITTAFTPFVLPCGCELALCI
jgi:hypothetical protein